MAHPGRPKPAERRPSAVTGKRVVSAHARFPEVNRRSTLRESPNFGALPAAIREGTRSTDGRLQPFEKGFAYMALQTRLPIVVVHGAHALRAAR